MAEAVRPAAGHTQIVTEHTRFARCEVTLIGVSSYPKGKGGFIEVYHPPHAAKPVFATPTIPQGTHTFNLSVAIAIIDDVDPSVELRFMRKRKSAAAPKTIVELGSHVIDLRETPAGLCTVPVTEAAGKLKFSVASWDISGALLHSATQAAENEDDDDLLPRLLPRFVGKTSTGTITLQQLTEIALELGVDCDADTLAHIVPANSRETIFLEDCIVYIGQAIRDEREGDAGAINHGAAGTGNGRNDANALLLAPWQYLWRKCRGTLQPEAELSFTACFTARNLLFLSSFFIFTTVSTAIIVYCSLTWLDTAVGRQQALLRATQDLMRIFFTTFERVALLANSVSVKDKTETIANWMLEHWRNEQLVTLQYAEKEAARVAAMLSAACVAMQSAYVDGLVARLTGLHAVLPTASTPVNASTVTALVAEWQRNRHPHNAAGRRQRPANHVAWEWKTFARVANVTLANISSTTTASVDPDAATMAAAYVPVGDLEAALCPTLAAYSAAATGQIFQQSRLLTGTGGASSPIAYTSVGTRVATLPPVDLCFVLTPAAKQAIAVVMAANRVQAADAASATLDARDPVREELSLWTHPFTFRRGNAGEASPYSASQLSNGYVRTTLPAYPARPWCTQFARCTELSSATATLASEAGSTSWRILGDDGTPWLAGGAFVPEIGAVVVVGRQLEAQARFYKQRQTDGFNYLNYEFVLTTELVLSSENDETGAVIPQSTMFRFDFGCHAGHCERFQYAAESAFAAARSGGAGFLFKPDYRPEPVVSAYAWTGEEIQRAVIVERDVQDLRSITLRNLIEITAEINSDAYSTYEMLILRFDGFQASRSFSSSDFTGCDTMYCIVRNNSLVWREDCQHCVIAPAITDDSAFQYRTPFRFSDECSQSIGGLPCASENLQTRNVDLARQALRNRPPEGDTYTITASDYRNKNVVAAYVYLYNLSTAVVYKVDHDTLQGPIVVSILVCVIVASVCTLIGLVGVLLATTHVISTIDRDSERYKAQVNAEKDKFAANISHLVPPHIAPRLKTLQQSVVAETSPSAVIVNMDTVGFSELVRGWSAAKIVSFTSYYFTLMTMLGKRHGLFNSKAFGDVFIGIGCFGRADERQREDSVLEAAQFAVIAVQLVSKEFAHNNAMEWAQAGGMAQRGKRKLQKDANGKLIDDTASSHNSTTESALLYAPGKSIMNEHGMEALIMPNVRIGCHAGALVSGYMNVGSTPRFDALGASLQVAARMQSTAGLGRIHCSEEFKELLDNADKNFDFEFDVQRRTILKGRVTHASYMLRSAHVPVPEDFLAAFGITRSHQDHNFEQEMMEAARRRQLNEGSSSLGSSRKSSRSVLSGQSRASSARM
jgi:class 3 adenylate cyclase